MTEDEEKIEINRLVNSMMDWGLDRYMPFHTEIYMLAAYLVCEKGVRVSTRCNEFATDTNDGHSWKDRMLNTFLGGIE